MRRNGRRRGDAGLPSGSGEARSRRLGDRMAPRAAWTGSSRGDGSARGRVRTGKAEPSTCGRGHRAKNAARASGAGFDPVVAVREQPLRVRGRCARPRCGFSVGRWRDLAVEGRVGAVARRVPARRREARCARRRLRADREVPKLEHPAVGHPAHRVRSPGAAPVSRCGTARVAGRNTGSSEGEERHPGRGLPRLEPSDGAAERRGDGPGDLPTRAREVSRPRRLQLLGDADDR